MLRATCDEIATVANQGPGIAVGDSGALAAPFMAPPDRGTSGVLGNSRQCR